MIKQIFIFTIILIIVVGCTQKTNVVGAGENENPEPISFAVGFDSFETFISYEDSIRNSNCSNLLIGNYENNEAITLLKLTSLPDSIYSLDNVYLSFKIKAQHNFDIIDETTFKIAKIVSQDWFETTATYFSPTDSTKWNNEIPFSEDDYEIIDDIGNYEITNDSLIIEFPENILQNWITDTTSTNYGLAIISENDNNFIELYSTEFSDDFAPKLCFDIQETETDTLISYQEKFNHDTFIYSSDDIYSIYSDEIKISNIQPIKSFLKFNTDNSLFTNEYSELITDTTTFIQQLTINKAKLILTSKNENLYPLSGSISIEPFLVTLDIPDTTNSETPIINSEDIEDLYIISSTDSLNSDEFKIDITKIIQAFTSGEYENNGIILKSVSENNNFIHEEFDIDETKIEIIFTPPYLDN